MTTAENITRRQIQRLRDEARNSVQPDWLQEAICTLALEGQLDEELNELNLTAMQFARVQHMTQEQAIAECASVIANAEALFPGHPGHPVTCSRRCCAEVQS